MNNSGLWALNALKNNSQIGECDTQTLGQTTQR